MKKGTPGFIGSRLREAREARGITAMSLADIVGLTRSAISLYELGGKTPSPEIMKRISHALQMPESYFRYPIRQRKQGTIFYRSMMAATKSARKRAEHRYAWLREIIYYLRAHVQFPSPRFPQLDIPYDPMLLSMDQIEELAMATRRFYNLGVGPMPNLVALLENNGVIVALDELGADTLDSFSEFDPEDQVLYMVLGTENASAVRSRFDAAHELGHAILHKNVSVSRFGRPAEYKLFEAQAHRFAAGFLLPAESFASEFYSATLESLQAIKSKWKVSIAMMIVRAHDLGFISDDTAKKLWIGYSRRRWRGNEPLDDKLLQEQPRILPLSFQLLLEKRIITKENVLASLPFNPIDIEKLAGLNPGLFSEKSPDLDPPVVILSLNKSTAKTSATYGNGDIVPFPLKK
ncbi:MAG: ImmA/IrrE family metallo-endopeptidase [Nitrospira sp.]|nr:ImmA/IrrE family metallo-endopeptidase [Nitrospira sp.]